MKISVTANIVVLASILALIPLSLFAQSQPITFKNSSDTIIVAANSVNDARIFDRVRYNPSAVYSGPFDKGSLYFHNPGNPKWMKGFRKDLSAVTCKEAYNSFVTTGTWKGHLNQNGTCSDPAEGVVWATGNKLNFDTSLK